MLSVNCESYKNLISTNLLIFLKCLNSHYDLTKNGRNIIYKYTYLILFTIIYLFS